jgi:NADH-quinone oxidoreductase E subunit
MASVLSAESLDEIREVSSRYPSAQAAVLPALYIAQKQLGFIPAAVQAEIAEVLAVPPTRVAEVVSFYTMFSAQPRGRHVVRICRNLPCQLRGAGWLIAKAEKILGIQCGETTTDRRITLEHEECLASCGTGPALWCDGKLVENLSEAKLEAFLTGLK